MGALLSPLDRYKLVEFVMVDLDDAGRTEEADLLRDALTPLWGALTDQDIDSLKTRGMILTASDLTPFLPTLCD